MNSRPLLITVAVVATLIGVDAVRHHGRQAAPASPQAPTTTGSASNEGGQPAATPRLGPLPGINEANAGTPTLDLMARLATRRRLEREGNRVYIDSLLANTDSTVVRWADRGDRPLVVTFLVDSTVPGWTSQMLDDMRAAMQAWDGNGAGLRFREGTPNDSADIKVRWVTSLPDSNRVGTTNVNWSPDGEIHGAEIVLALQEPTRHTALSAPDRRRTACHELGHALGLPHSADRDDLMFPSSLVSSPSRRDQATLQLLYAVPPGSLHVSN